MAYDHTQIGYVIIGSIFGVIVLLGVCFILLGFNAYLLETLLFCFFLLSSFITLRVWIDQEYLRLKFGWGLFRLKFPIKNISDVREVRNPWYVGWGIHVYLLPATWVFSVSGFQAVEITLKNNRKYRIGTDDPKGLEDALKKAIT